jgi:3-oxoacyl-[acyl-carrier-protein] synthase II
MDAFIHYGMAAGIQAIENSGLEITEENAERIGVAIGAGIGGLGTIRTTKGNRLSLGFNIGKRINT